METLGYGTYLVIDGFNANKEQLNAEVAEGFLLAIAALLGALRVLEPEVRPVADLPTGVSAALLLPEAHASIHLFEQEQLLNLRVFSRHELELSSITSKLRDTFGARRFESHLNHYSKTLSKDPERRRVTLLGDRAYAAARLLAEVV